MDDRFYRIINEIDDCFQEVSELKELAELLRDGFAVNENVKGEVAMKTIAHFLDHIAEHLNRCHTVVDEIGLLGKSEPTDNDFQFKKIPTR